MTVNLAVPAHAFHGGGHGGFGGGGFHGGGFGGGGFRGGGFRRGRLWWLSWRLRRVGGYGGFHGGYAARVQSHSVIYDAPDGLGDAPQRIWQRQSAVSTTSANVNRFNNVNA